MSPIIQGSEVPTATLVSTTTYSRYFDVEAALEAHKAGASAEEIAAEQNVPVSRVKRALWKHGTDESLVDANAIIGEEGRVIASGNDALDTAEVETLVEEDEGATEEVDPLATAEGRKARAVELAAEGKTEEEIAEEIGVTVATVRKYLS